MPDELNLDELERLEKAMTPGPWLKYDTDIFIDGDHQGPIAICASGFSRGVALENALGIVALRNAFPALLAKVREQAARIAELERAIGNGNYLTDTQKLEPNAEHIALLNKRIAELEAQVRAGADKCQNCGHLMVGLGYPLMCANCTVPRTRYDVTSLELLATEKKAERITAKAKEAIERLEARIAELEAERKGDVRLTVEQAETYHIILSRLLEALSDRAPGYMPFMVQDARVCGARLAAAIAKAKEDGNG